MSSKDPVLPATPSSIFDFVSPGLLGPLQRFEERFARPIADGDHRTAARLRATIHPFILRRTKQEVAKDLPEKLEMDQICDLTGEQRAIYMNVAREVRAQVLGEVALWGTIIEHRDGYRAEFGYPLRLSVPSAPMPGFPGVLFSPP